MEEESTRNLSALGLEAEPLDEPVQLLLVRPGDLQILHNLPVVHPNAPRFLDRELVGFNLDGAVEVVEFVEEELPAVHVLFDVEEFVYDVEIERPTRTVPHVMRTDEDVPVLVVNPHVPPACGIEFDFHSVEDALQVFTEDALESLYLVESFEEHRERVELDGHGALNVYFECLLLWQSIRASAVRN